MVEFESISNSSNSSSEYGENEALLGDDEIAALAKQLAPVLHQELATLEFELTDKEFEPWMEQDPWYRYCIAAITKKLLQLERAYIAERSPTMTR